MFSALRSSILRPALLRTSFRTFSTEGAASREIGTVKWFDSSKGFGFIVRETGDDLFVHFSAIRGSGYRTLEEGQQVEFSVATGHKGTVASDVTAKAPSQQSNPQ